MQHFVPASGLFKDLSSLVNMLSIARMKHCVRLAQVMIYTSKLIQFGIYIYLISFNLCYFWMNTNLASAEEQRVLLADKEQITGKVT